jgi:hypothetical protein
LAALVEAGGDATPLLEPVHTPLHDILELPRFRGHGG